jgi:hypothetical protein
MKDRLIASGIHLGISLLVAVFILLLLFLVWFPSPLMGLGAVQGVQLILLVDLAIGPLLTLVVFRRGKPSLVMDLSIIVVLQVAALTYGLITVYSQTPSFLVLTYEGLYVVSRHEEKTYLSDSELSMNGELLENPVRYAGKIPVFLLSEPQDMQARSMQNNGFMFGESLPYYLNTAKFQSFEDFNHLLQEGTASKSDDSDCVELNLISPHGEASACLQTAEQNLRAR